MIDQIGKIFSTLREPHVVKRPSVEVSVCDLAKLMAVVKVNANIVANQNNYTPDTARWIDDLSENIDRLREQVDSIVWETKRYDDAVEKALEEAVEQLNNLMASAGEVHLIGNAEVRSKVWAMTNGLCTYCGIQLTDDGKGGATAFCVEHVVPSSKGGPNHLNNYVPSCHGCNSAKSDRHVLHFIRNVLPSRIQTNVVSIKEAQAPLPAAPEIRIVAGDRE